MKKELTLSLSCEPKSFIKDDGEVVPYNEIVLTINGIPCYISAKDKTAKAVIEMFCGATTGVIE